MRTLFAVLNVLFATVVHKHTFILITRQDHALDRPTQWLGNGHIDDFDAEGNGFELIGLLIIFDPVFYLIGFMSTLVTVVPPHRLATSQPNSYVPIVLICQWWELAQAQWALNQTKVSKIVLN